jgi:arylsulfatase A-like enzyme
VGDRGTTGVPEKQGFDVFYGYYHQVHAHTYFPNYLLKNSEKVMLPGNTGDKHKGETFSQYLIYDETMKFIRENRDGPFFCYIPWIMPHGLWGIPEDDPSWQIFKDSTWDVSRLRDAQIYAAYVHMADSMTGEIFRLLEELKIENNTIVFFSGDNGGAHYFKSKEHPEGFFLPNGGRFRGMKSDLYEGALRVPAIVRWPGKIKPGQVNDHVWYFPDLMPTFTELAGLQTPSHTDGISIVPTLLGEEAAGRDQENHEYLYWEYTGGRAVRSGNWKLVRQPLMWPKIQHLPLDSVENFKQNPWELYDLSVDEGEKNNIAGQHPEILKKLIGYAEEAHVPVREGSYIPGGKELGFKGHEFK